MKIEKINDNQIRCTLNKADLAARHLKISELAYGSDKAKALFRDMMQQASAELGFDAEDIPLMIEAIPVSAECIVLIVTKVDDPEELDTRFSRFSSDNDDDNDSFYPFDYDFDDFDTIENISCNSPAPTAADELDEDDNSDSDDVVLPDAKTANDVINLFSKVKEYLNKNIEKITCTSSDFNKTCNILSEYGNKENMPASSLTFFDEHYECIIKKHAIQTIVKI